MGIKLLVCGGRDFEDVDFIVEKLAFYHERLGFDLLVHGAARGVDSIAGAFAEELNIQQRAFPVTDSDWTRLGKKAGILRNIKMYDETRPDLVMAFPGGRGTAHMVEYASKKKCTIWQSNKILFRKEDPKYGFLSNFYEGFEIVDDDGVIWKTSEHFYQAQKSPIESERQYVYEATTAWDSKVRGHEIQVTSDWLQPPWESYGGRQEEAMRHALRLKFASGSKAAQMLLDTNDDYLVEYAPWGDTYWGVDKTLKGLNRLGKLLMERRDQLFLETLQ